MHKYFSKIAQTKKASSSTVLDSKPARPSEATTTSFTYNVGHTWQCNSSHRYKTFRWCHILFIFFFLDFGLDSKWALNGYMEMKGQATSLMHFYSSRKIFHRKRNKKVVRWGWEESKVMPLQGWSMVHLLGIKCSTGHIFSCEESTSSAPVWKV